MSEFSVPVVRLGKVSKHLGADTLSTVVVEGETTIIRTGDFVEGDLAVYIPVDAVVPTTVPGTEFLGDHRRIKAKRLRGIYSEGLLLPLSTISTIVKDGLPPGPGDDVAGELGIKKHEDKVPDTWGTGTQGPSLPPRTDLLGRFFHWCFRDAKKVLVKDPGVIPVYDIEPYKRHRGLFEEGEEVVISEKLHGTNSRYAQHKGTFYAGSRNNFWRDMSGRCVPFREKFGEWVRTSVLRRPEHIGTPKPNLYWQIARQYDMDLVCQGHPDLVFYGEIYGQVQDLRYDAAPGQVWFRVFDIYDIEGEYWLDWDEVEDICKREGLDTVPVLYRGPWNEEAFKDFVEGKSTIASCIREGAVIKPVVTRDVPHLGRLILKWVSEGYKLRKGPTTELQ